MLIRNVCGRPAVPAALAILAGGAMARPSPAQVRLVLNSAASPLSSDPFPLERLGDRVLLGAESARGGRELYITDGTAAGTALVTDIRPGPASALAVFTPQGKVSLFARLGDRIIFAADDGMHGNEPWITDGTAAGTRLLKDVNPGAASSDAYGAFVENGVLYFTADDGVHGFEPWRTDGAESGTQLAADVVLGAESSNAALLGTDATGQYFGSLTPPGLWRKNFALPSAVRLHEIDLDSDRARMLDGRLIFAGASAAAGVEIWKSEATFPTTAQLSDIEFGVVSSFPRSLTPLNGRMFFLTSSTSRPLFGTDGTAAGTLQVSVSGFTIQRLLGTFGGRLMMQVADGTGRKPRLWLWDPVAGSPGSTQINPFYLYRPVDQHIYTSFGPSIIEENGSLYMLGETVTNTPAGPQVFRYTPPGTAATRLTSAAGPGPTFIQSFAMLNGRVIAAAYEAGQTELWAGDPLVAGASQRIADLNPADAGSSHAWLRAAGPSLYFLDLANPSLPMLRRTSGAPGSTAALGVVQPDLVVGDPAQGPAALGGSLFFENRTLASGLELWTIGSADAAPRLVRDISPGALSTTLDLLTPSGGLVYFRVTDGATVVWRSDGTEAGTFAVSSPTGAAGNFADLNGVLVFVGRASPSDPPALWKTEGAAAGAVRIRSLPWLSIGGTPITPVPGAGESGVAFFASGSLAPEGRELWKTDGTEAGTTIVRDIVPGPGGSSPSQITAAGVEHDGRARVYFVAGTPEAGAELWTSDGTFDGTRRVIDLAPGAASAQIQNLCAALREQGPGSATTARAFFTAQPGPGGARLFTSDGTEVGTFALPPVNALGDAAIGNLTPTRRGGKVYFTADDGVHGLELWVSDGTPEGTAMVQDLWPGPGSGLAVKDASILGFSPQLTIVNSRLYFLGDDGQTGQELRVLDLCPADFNNDGAPTVQDLFDYLGAWFAGADRADTSADGAVTLQDLFDFLGAWFGGC